MLVQLIDSPFRVSGAARVMTRELVLPVARVWWQELWPPEEKAKKKKKGSGKGKKGSKKKGKKKSGKKS